MPVKQQAPKPPPPPKPPKKRTADRGGGGGGGAAAVAAAGAAGGDPSPSGGSRQPQSPQIEQQKGGETGGVGGSSRERPEPARRSLGFSFARLAGEVVERRLACSVLQKTSLGPFVLSRATLYLTNARLVVVPHTPHAPEDRAPAAWAEDAGAARSAGGTDPPAPLPLREQQARERARERARGGRGRGRGRDERVLSVFPASVFEWRRKTLASSLGSSGASRTDAGGGARSPAISMQGAFSSALGMMPVGVPLPVREQQEPATALEPAPAPAPAAPAAPSAPSAAEATAPADSSSSASFSSFSSSSSSSSFSVAAMVPASQPHHHPGRLQVKLKTTDMREIKIVTDRRGGERVVAWLQMKLALPAFEGASPAARVFAFAHARALRAKGVLEDGPGVGWDVFDTEREFVRLGAIRPSGGGGGGGSSSGGGASASSSALPPPQWALHENRGFELSPTYPASFVVPSAVTAAQLHVVAQFRSRARFAVLSWLHPANGACICRSSQPSVGMLGKTSAEDDALLRAIWQTNPRHGPGALLQIVDARSRIAALGNMVAKGMGFESPQDYCRVHFLGIENIHVMRTSLQKLFLLINRGDRPGARTGFLSALEATCWLDHISAVLSGAMFIADLVETDGLSVLVHCSDGWDRTSQCGALAQLVLDPYYRTLDGFAVLIEKEWVAMGHKFADRSHRAGREGERAPLFLQFCDCVHQLLRQHPAVFEFNEALLLVLVDAVQSRCFGSFLFNSARERAAASAETTTASVWSFVAQNRSRFLSPFYDARAAPGPLAPIYCAVRRLALWNAFFFRYDEPLVARAPSARDLVLAATASARAQGGGGGGARAAAAAAASARGAGLGAAAGGGGGTGDESARGAGGDGEDGNDDGDDYNHDDNGDESVDVDFADDDSSDEDTGTEGSDGDGDSEADDDPRGATNPAAAARAVARAVARSLYDAGGGASVDEDDDPFLASQRSSIMSHAAMEPDSGFGFQISAARPCWIPDNWQSFCTTCRRPFSRLLRRHHCRRCGEIFCNRCSSHRTPIPDLLHFKAVRVCEQCFPQVSGAVETATRFKRRTVALP